MFTLLFDWGNTLMIDYPDEAGPMYTWKKISPVRHAREALAALHKKYPCYLATNAKDSSKHEIQTALEMAGLHRYISGIFCFKEIGYEKGSREYFDCILNELKIDKGRLVMIGDDPEKDYAGAERNGIAALLYDPEEKADTRRYRVIHDLMELEKVIPGMTHVHWRSGQESENL